MLTAQVFALLLAPLGCKTSGPAATQATAETWTPQKADKWFRSREWANGLKLNVQESVNKVEFAKQYHANKAAWDKAFAYFRDTNLEELPVGTVKVNAVFGGAPGGSEADRGDSGAGRGYGPDLLGELMALKAVHWEPAPPA